MAEEEVYKLKRIRWPPGDADAAFVPIVLQVRPPPATAPPAAARRRPPSPAAADRPP